MALRPIHARRGAAFSLESWVRPRDVFMEDAGRSRSLGLAPPFPMDLSAFTAERIEATAKDGTKIPVDVVYRKGIRRDGSNPALVDAYGAYGEPVDADFRPDILSFLMQGGVIAEAHVRGGGKFGESWHLAGKGANKPNTWRDVIASVEALEQAGFTSPGRIAGMGVSAGGIMIGRTVTERPDLLAAAVMWAPMVNTLRFETTEGGPANTAEFGSLASEQGYRELKEMDAYSHVVDGRSTRPSCSRAASTITAFRCGWRRRWRRGCGRPVPAASLCACASTSKAATT